MTFRLMLVSIAWVLATLSARPGLAQTSILLADDTKTPRVEVAWPTRSGETTLLKGERRFQSAAQKAPLGPNIDCYTALGGTRLNKGMADPSGAVILVGLYKQDAARPFFESIKDGGAVTITLKGVIMNQPAVPRPKTAMMHLKYMMSDLTACGLSGDARNLFNTSDPEDPIIARASGGSVRAGCLDGKGSDHGSVDARVEADGSITLKVTFPYALLRHTQDPYQRTNPGGFFEPNHFHIEIELLPKAKVDKPAAPPPGDAKPQEPPKADPGKEA